MKLLSNLNPFKPKQIEIKPVSQPHEMILMLLKSYPKPIDTWIFNQPSVGIMNQWEICRVLREMGAKIETLKRPHVNQYKRNIEISSYVLTDFLSGQVVEKKLRESKHNKVK